jgi:hypothetical protein
MPCRYEFSPGLALAVDGSRAVLAHFDAEYGVASAAVSGPVDVEVRFEPPPSNGPATILEGGHKTVRWHVGLAPPENEPLRAWIRLGGRPRSFGLSLVQGYFVEPLVSVAAAHRGYVLLPAAAFVDDGSALILMGRSRSGKSTLAALALAVGRRVLGDDQVLLEEPRRCRAFPRRLRLYPDLRRTAPRAYAALTSRSRHGLNVRRAGEAVSRGYVRPPIRVQATELGLAAPSPFPIGRVVLLERGGPGRELSVERLDTGAVVEAGAALLAEQRSELRAAADENWGRALAAVTEREATTFRRLLDGVRAERITLPAAWDSARAIAALAERFRLGRAERDPGTA